MELPPNNLTPDEILRLRTDWAAFDAFKSRAAGVDWGKFVAGFVPTKFQAFVAATLMALTGSGTWLMKPAPAPVNPPVQVVPQPAPQQPAPVAPKAVAMPLEGSK